MTIWSSIKKFLNSSLGTKDFETLDNMLVGKWQLEASDEIYYDLFYKNELQGTITRFFEAQVDGSVRIKAWYSLGSIKSSSVTVKIYINDVLMYEKNQLSSFTQDITLSKGDILKIEISNPDRYKDFSLQILASETKKAFSEE